MSKGKLTGRTWFNLILFSLMGQIAWNVENMFFNTFLFDYIYKGATQNAINNTIEFSSAVNIMVSLSAITAVLTTFVMGTLSDKINKRKIFISAGYIAWGITTAAFGVISRDNVAMIFGLKDEIKILTVTIWAVIIMDCIMTFMGSTSNDSCFNAWVTDVTDTSNRQKVESIFAVLPIAAMGIVLGAGGLIAAKFGYPKFFIFLGALVSLCGVMGLFTMQDSRSGVKQNTNYWSDLLYGFRPSVIKEHKGLYLAFAAVCFFSIAVQVFFPYLIVYLQHVILPTANGNLINPTTIACAVFAVVVILAGIILLLKNADKMGRENAIIVSSIFMVVGLFLLGFAHTLNTVLLVVGPVVVGYAVIGILINASIRDLTPEDKAGLFQGIRMIFYVLLPMVIGPLIGNIAIQKSDVTYVNEYNVVTTVPTALMFTCAAVVCMLVFIPVVMIKKQGLRKAEDN